MNKLMNSLKSKGSTHSSQNSSGNSAVNTAIRPSSVLYFYGRITREEAEQNLQERGGKQGLFLLRESISPMGNYAISICHGPRVHHYSIEKQVDGCYKIPEGKPFPGPVELIQHYQNNADGFVTPPTYPCNRFSGQSPVGFRGITYHQLEKALQFEAKKINADMERAMGTMRDTLVKRVAQNLHVDMPWFHGKLSRQVAEDRIKKDGHVEGKFIVRQRDEKSTFALTLSCDGSPRHYFISMRADNRYAIEDGPRFDCLMMLVDHYHNKSDGLACKLRMPCCRPGYSSIDYEQYMVHSSARNREQSTAVNLDRRPSRSLPPIPNNVDGASGGGGGSSSRRALPKLPGDDAEVSNGFTRDTRSSQSEDFPPEVRLDINVDELENVYGSSSVRQAVITKKLEPSQVVLEELKLGAGNFGSVMKGICKMDSREIPVAVKTLKKSDLQPGVQSELVKEAEVMKTLDHKHIVRMIGICEGETLMLVLELAKLGPLNKFLHKNKQLPLWNVLELMWQVALGMEYLEASNFVHRDLAARNILLCDEHFAKISDFGMSKTLGREDSYYVAQQVGKWPLKWYALECIDFWKFDSKTDVWSFGITLWEATSYGSKPYYKMQGQETVEFLRMGNRLSKPIGCSEDVYQVMLTCWTEDRSHRPTFKQLVPSMEELYKSHRMAGI